MKAQAKLEAQIKKATAANSDSDSDKEDDEIPDTGDGGAPWVMMTMNLRKPKMIAHFTTTQGDALGSLA